MFVFAFTHWHSKCASGDPLSDSSGFVWLLFALPLFINALEEHCLLPFKLDVSYLAITTREYWSFTGSLHQPAFHKHIFLHPSSTFFPHPDSTPFLFSTLLSPSPPAFASCYLSKIVLDFQIHQMFSVQQDSRSEAVGGRTFKLFISHLPSVANLGASAMNKASASW